MKHNSLVHTVEAPAESESEIAQMLRPYLAELGSGEPYPYLSLYWLETGRHPYLIVSDDDLAGFALVRQIEAAPVFQMAEFYVLPACRRAGVGSIAAHEIIKKHPGAWEMQVLPDNTRALAFWSSVSSHYPEMVIQRHPSSGAAAFHFHSAYCACDCR